MTLSEALGQLSVESMDAYGTCGHCGSDGDRRTWSVAGQQAIEETLDSLIALLFPGCRMRDSQYRGNFKAYFPVKLQETMLDLRDHCCQALRYQCAREKCDPATCNTCEERAEEIAASFVTYMPELMRLLRRDVQAAYEGDPAAKSELEVVLSYPGMYAVIVHRIAHHLYKHNVPLVPRIMSECAHSRTGIDIHPGATIGEGFFIDHGTGVVIGETCVIGRRVKLYQGVTLGALSFQKDADGHLVKGIKRHPDVEDNVVIYSGATILGGDTVIGAGSVIGGNVWLTHSVPSGSKVYNQQPRPHIRAADGAWHVAKGDWNDHGAGI
jgi:serine O-acetyltransferase